MVLRFCFQHIQHGLSIVKTKIRESEENTWENFVLAHPSYRLAETYLNLVSPEMFWFISNQYPDLFTHLHIYIIIIIIIIHNFGFSEHVPWTIRSDESLCLFVKKLKTTYISFFFIASILERILNCFDHIWTSELQTAVLQMAVKFLLSLRILTKTAKLCCFWGLDLDLDLDSNNMFCRIGNWQNVQVVH